MTIEEKIKELFGACEYYALVNNDGYTFNFRGSKYDLRHWVNCYGAECNSYTLTGYYIGYSDASNGNIINVFNMLEKLYNSPVIYRDVTIKEYPSKKALYNGNFILCSTFHLGENENIYNNILKQYKPFHNSTRFIKFELKVNNTTNNEHFEFMSLYDISINKFVIVDEEFKNVYYSIEDENGNNVFNTLSLELAKYRLNDLRAVPDNHIYNIVTDTF